MIGTDSIEVLHGDRIDVALVLAGLRRADTPRLRQLLEATRRRAEGIVRARLEAGAPLDGFAWSLRWARRGRRWRELAAADVEHRPAPAAFFEPGRLRCGQSGIDAAIVIRGPHEMLTGECVRLSAIDWLRGTFAFDHVARVLADGRLGPLRSCLPGRPGVAA